MLTKMRKMVMKKEVTDKLKRRRKEIAKKKAAVVYAPREQDNSYIRMLGNWSAGDWK